MSLTSELNKARRKRLEEEENRKTMSPSDQMLYSRLNIAAGKAAAQKDEDIAPVKDTTKSDDRKWFEKGAFEDGYQFGDVTKTLFGTGADLENNVKAGVLGIGEKVVDAGAYVAGGIGKLFGADEFADKTKDFIAKDLYDEEKLAEKMGMINPSSWINALLNGGKTEENSLLGEKTDALAQSAGQLVGTVALQAAGVPWWATTGVTGFSGEVENAFDKGATYGEAGASGLISAGAEILTEKLSGGIKFGGKTLGDAGVQPLVDKISNKVVRTAVNLGLDALGEGGEEVISQIFSNLGSALYREEDLSEILASEEAFDEYLESFIGGAALGGGMGTVNAASSIKSGRDYKTGLTSNEQKVLDKEIENRITEAESDGKKLTSKEKAKIEEEARSDLEKGYISTDTIESALGGKTYQAYQDAIANDEGAIKELETMFEGAELEQAIGGITKNSKQGELKAQTSKEVAELIKNGKDGYLSESYNEIERRKQAFEADTSKYKGKQQETIQKAIDSGILNNTRKTHEFVDMIAKISADKGVSFDFTNNEKLAETGFAVEGKTVNGFVNNGTITTNIDSAKALNTVVGHEITHVLEGTEIYGELQKAITEYAETKGEYKDRLKAAIELYKDIDGYKGAEGMDAIKREVVSDLVGEYLFTDADFVNNLSAKNRNIFQKIYDEIKYLCKIATAGSKEARELEKVKRAFEKAYKGGTATTETATEATTETAAEASTETATEIIEGTTEAAEAPVAETAAEAPTTEKTEAATEAPAAEIEAPTAETEAETGEKDSNGNTLTEAKAKRLENSKVRDNDGKLKVMYRTVSKYGGGGYETFGSQYGDIFKSGVFTDARRVAEADARKDGLGGLMINEKYLNITNPIDMDAKADAQAWKDAFPDASFPESGANWKFYGALEEYLKGAKHSKSKIAETARAVLNNMGYDGITHKGGSEYGAHQVYVALESEQIQDMTDPVSETETDAKAESGTKFSLSDSDGKKLTKEQNEYFKNSKMRDDNGALKVMYHGSQYAGFHTFDADFSDDGASLFFVDRNDVAASYSGTSETYTAPTFHTAEDFNKFFAEIGQTEYEVKEEMYGKNKWFVLYEDGSEIASSETAKMLYDEFRDWTGLGEGEANYKVYLNLTNPLEVDAQGRDWNRLMPPDGNKEEYRYIEVVEVGDVPGQVTVKYAMNSDGKPITETVDIYTKFNEQTALEVSDMVPGQRIEFVPVKPATTREYAQYAKENGYDGVIFKNIVDNGGYGTGSEGASTVAIAFDSNQIKSVANATPTSDADIRYSLSENGETSKTYGNYNVYGKDVRLEAPGAEDIAPTAEAVSKTVDETVTETAKEVAPMPKAAPKDVYDEGAPIAEDIADALGRYNAASLTDADAPPEMDAPIYGDEEATAADPFENRDIKEVGNRKVKAYMYENPEVKPFFQAEANVMLGELQRSTKGERFYNDELYYETNGEKGFFGTERETSGDIAYLLDECKYTYAQIEKGLKAIIEDNGAENNAVSKRIEFLLNDRLLKGTTDFITGAETPPNQDYINLLNEKQILEYSEEARKKFFEVADDYAPIPEAAETAAKTAVSKESEDIAPVAKKAPEKYEAIRPPKEKQPRLIKVTEETTGTQTELFPKTAEILTEEPEAKKKGRGWAKFRANFLDKHSVFEDLALKTKNRELMGKANQMLNAESAAQWLIGKGADGVKALNDMRAEVENAGLTKRFYEYLYHNHNIDRMSLEERYGIPNKAVFGDSVTADISREATSKIEAEHPEFTEYAKDVYDYMSYLRQKLVDNGVISQELANLWAEMYPHYVPIRRVGDTGLNINVPLDTGRTGINAPIKRATGGNSDILPLFDTMAMRTEQTFRAVAKNRFGVELKNTLNPELRSAEASLDEVIDGIDNHEGLLKKGENGRNPTFTVFEHGKRMEFDITEDMYDALKPTSDGLRYTNPVANKATNLFRGVITEYNPVFMATNAIKDAQDILMNSQHAAKTYANLPGAVWQLASKGKWYTEYMQNGGEQNTYFDGQTNTFKKQDNAFKKIVGMPLRAIQKANNFIERAPRLAEYMASRKKGASAEVAMLDAARVTTNFAAGGDVTKFLNRNGATFLNASVQGFNQQVRNIREAKANGLKGWTQLAAKTAIAGLPALLLNNLLWDDDEEYNELSDYVKENYYVVAKYGDGQFVRIPKGRTVAVIQNAFEQVANAATGDDEIDLGRFLDLAISNLAPNNPIDNNILSPVIQTANNKTWYGEDLVPTRLQDLPDAEQFDESTDAFSKWLGEKRDYSPYKINYLLNQYGGGLADVFLPMGTPEAERGDDSFGGNLIAPLKDKFTTDGVMNNQNVTDFYSTVDELTKSAKSAYATDEDVLKYKYMNSVNAELGELYQQKRDIQNSDLSNAEKYEQAREIQKQIDAMTKEGLNTYNDVNIDGGYATVGDVHFRWYEPSADSDAEAGWQKISGKQLEKQEKVTNGLGISASEYWSNKEEYDYAYDYPEKYAVSKAVGGYEAYKSYSSELYDIKADKDENGKSISGSRKEKVIDYINNMDADYGEKIILFKSEYNADDTYNYDIIDYLNSREDISYEDMSTILKELGFTVHSDGRVTW